MRRGASASALHDQLAPSPFPINEPISLPNSRPFPHHSPLSPLPSANVEPDSDVIIPLFRRVLRYPRDLRMGWLLLWGKLYNPFHLLSAGPLQYLYMLSARGMRSVSFFSCVRFFIFGFFFRFFL